MVDFVSDMNAFQSAIKVLMSLQKNVDRIKYVETAYQGFMDLKDSMRKHTRIGQIKLEKEARSFFTEFSVFLDHWKKRISCHSRREEFKKLYDQLTHDAYDNSDDYAMATIIRNYAVHFASIIIGTVWGNTYYDVSVWKYELLKDDSISQNKKEIINRQPSEFILLSSIMKGALDKLKEIQKVLIAFTIDEETCNALNTVAEVIKQIRRYGDKQWFITDDNGSLTTMDKDGQPVEYIKGKCLEMFDWNEFDGLITTINELMQWDTKT